MKRESIKIRVAYGIQSRDYRYVGLLIEFLRNLKNVKKKGTYQFEYEANGKMYDIQVLFSKSGFLEALDEPGAIVIYEGHSRYGQGPAFVEKVNVGVCPGADEFPKNPWEDHVRMGWDVVRTASIMDIHRHGTNPREYSSKKKSDWISARTKYMIDKASKNENQRIRCDAERTIKKRGFNECYPSIEKLSNCRGVKSLVGRSFWELKHRTQLDKEMFEGSQAIQDIDREFFTLVKGGRSDLLNSKLECSVLFLKSCKSIEHFYCALRHKRKEVQKSCVFYLTKEASAGIAQSPKLLIEMVL
ncbi:MAG: hypothetical protein ACFFAY_13700, partial [Promethearchaeota archaeon]